MTQLDLLGYQPPATAPHVGHSRTSRDAAKSIRGALNTLERRVLEAIRAAGAEGLSDEECQRVTGLGSSTQRPRRVELVAIKLVRDSGQTRRGVSGRKCVVWVVA